MKNYLRKQLQMQQLFLSFGIISYKFNAHNIQYIC